MATDADGVLSGAGLAKTGVGAYVVGTNTAANVQAALDALVFTPTARQVGAGQSVTTGIGVTVSDGSGTASGGTFLTATAVNPAPVLGGLPATEASTDQQTTRPFATATITDANPGVSETATITLLQGGTASDADGTLSGTALTKTGVGTYTLASGTPGNEQAALQALVFTPTVHQVASGQAVTTGIALSVANGLATASGGTVLTATALNTPPSLGGAMGPQTIGVGATARPFGALTIADPDFGAMESVSVTVTAGGSASDANGVLSGAGLTRVGVGAYVLAAGTPAAAQAALRALVFTPTPNQAPANGSVPTGFTVGVSDGMATAAATASVIALGPTGATPFATLAVQDANAAALVTVSAFVQGTSGSFANLGGGTATASGYTVSGTAAQVSAALANVLFTPGANQPAATVAFATLVDGGGVATLVSTDVAGSVLQVSSVGEVAMAGSGADTLYASAANTVLMAGPGPDTLVGYAGGASTLIGGPGGDLFYGLGGPVVIQGGSGHDLIDVTSGPSTITSGTGGSLIAPGPGNAVIVGMGPDTIFAGGGADSITAAANSLVGLGGGSDTLAAGTGDVVIGGAGAASVTMTGVGGLFFAGSGTATFLGGSGSSTVVGGSGTDFVSGGAGGGLFGAGAAGGSVLTAGQQRSVLLGRASGDRLVAVGSGGDVLAAGAGNESLVGAGSSGADVFYAGSGADVITLGSGADMVFAGSGSASVSGGSGAELYGVVNGQAGGTEVISGFKLGVDRLVLGKFGAGEVARDLAGATVGAGGTTVTLSDGTRVTFAGLAAVDARVFG